MNVRVQLPPHVESDQLVAVTHHFVFSRVERLGPRVGKPEMGDYQVSKSILAIMGNHDS